MPKLELKSDGDSEDEVVVPEAAPLKNLRSVFRKLGELDIEYTHTSAQLTDCLTRVLAPTMHWKLIQQLMNIPCSDIPGSVKMAAAAAKAAAEQNDGMGVGNSRKGQYRSPRLM